jgi:transcription antitermination factor NusG
MAKLREDQHWVAVEVFTGKEISVNSQLERRAINTFLPTHKIKRLRAANDRPDGSRHRILELALFPGYLFANIFPYETQSVVRCPGVMGIVSLRGEHVALDPDEILELRARTDADGCLVSGLKVGQQARIKDGPYAGHQGEIEKLDTDELIARIRCQIFGKTWHIETSPYELQAVGV